MGAIFPINSVDYRIIEFCKSNRKEIIEINNNKVAEKLEIKMNQIEEMEEIKEITQLKEFKESKELHKNKEINEPSLIQNADIKIAYEVNHDQNCGVGNELVKNKLKEK